MSRELPKEDFPTVWESRSQGLGVPTLHYHFLTLFLGDHSLFHMSIPRILCVQAASLPPFPCQWLPSVIGDVLLCPSKPHNNWAVMFPKAPLPSLPDWTKPLPNRTSWGREKFW